MICHLLARLLRVGWRGPLTAAPRGGGPMLDRHLDAELTPAEFDDWWDELAVEAGERGLTGADRDRWIERQINAVPFPRCVP